MFGWFKKTTPLQSKVAESVIEDFSAIDAVADYIKIETGITFEKQMEILRNKLISYCRKNSIHSFRRLLERVAHDFSLRQGLFDAVTTNETFFYREFKQIEELTKAVRAQHRSVRILCAPCATGEEPYSIAIALLEAGVHIQDFDILGIDINQEAVDKAKEALYKERNLRNLSEAIRHKYFTQEGTLYRVNHQLKDRVRFEVINIFDENFAQLGSFDYIFSRNMLIYFDYETKLKAKAILEAMRKDQTQEIYFGHADLF